MFSRILASKNRSRSKLTAAQANYITKGLFLFHGQQLRKSGLGITGSSAESLTKDILATTTFETGFVLVMCLCVFRCSWWQLSSLEAWAVWWWPPFWNGESAKPALTPRGRIQREIWCMGPHAWAGSNLTLSQFYFQMRLLILSAQHGLWQLLDERPTSCYFRYFMEPGQLPPHFHSWL